MFGCRQQFSLPENAGGVSDLPLPDFDDQDLSSFEMVPDFWLQEQSSDEEPEIGDVKTPFNVLKFLLRFTFLTFFCLLNVFIVTM